MDLKKLCLKKWTALNWLYGTQHHNVSSVFSTPRVNLSAFPLPIYLSHTYVLSYFLNLFTYNSQISFLH
jgi:hypothetical protein